LPGKLEQGGFLNEEVFISILPHLFSTAYQRSLWERLENKYVGISADEDQSFVKAVLAGVASMLKPVVSNCMSSD
jgi:hypothetical protein